MSSKKGLVFFFLLLSFCFSLVWAAENDVKGSQDHPLLSRMPEFFISGYQLSDFASYGFIDQNKQKTAIEGKKIYIEYKLNKGAVEPGELKIRRNIQEALKKIGGTVLFDDNFNRCSTILVKQDGQEVWIEIRSYNNMYRLNTVVKQAMEQTVEASAEKLGQDIHSTGHVSIYGIHFDTNKADIKAESEAAIAEIVKLLKAEGTLRVHVVGHTDSDGAFDFNLKLSKDRAEAVLKALVSRGISVDRLKAHGVASLAPVASNDSEAGKQKNRRVELVKQ